MINKKELLQVGDPVQFQVDSKDRAVNIIAIRKKQRAHVDTIKGLLKLKYLNIYSSLYIIINIFRIFWIFNI